MATDQKNETTIFAIHRCRFVDYAPSAITALAFPPFPLPSVNGKSKELGSKWPSRFGTLAIGHANGNIDLCEWTGAEHEAQSSQAWVLRKTISGPYPSKVDSLAFSIRHPDELDEDDVPKYSDLRLFSSGGGSELIEWDIERSCIRRIISSEGGSIWSIAANPSSTCLALGCEDGTVRILSLDNDALTHLRRLGKVKCRMLSVAWGPPVPKQANTKLKQEKYGSASSDDDDSDDDNEEWTDSWLVTGGSDSSLRKWDVNTGRVLERMGTDKIRGERTLVWTVGVLGDGTIVSGDSMGMVKFWDSRTCTQLQSFQAHGADVLCMAISPEGKAVYTSGVDQKTIQFSLVKTSTETSATRWAQTSSKRMHSHDVRTLTTWPPYTPLPSAYKRHFSIGVAPILASGGLDMNVVLAPAALPSSTIVKIVNPLNTSTEATFEDGYHRKLAYTSPESVRVARQARFVSCMREAGLSVWRVAKKQGSMNTKNEDEDDADEKVNKDEQHDLIKGKGREYSPAELEEPFAGGWEKILEMGLKASSNLVAHQISDDGSWLVVSDTYETKLFRLQVNDNNQLDLKRIRDFSSTLKPHIPVQTSSPYSATPSLPHHPGTGALAFQFTPDSSKLVLSTMVPSYILVVDLTGDNPRVLRRFEHHLMQDSIVHNRTVMKGRVEQKKEKKVKVHVNGTREDDDDVEMQDAEEKEKEDEQEGEDEEGEVAEDEDDEPIPKSKPLSKTVGVRHLAISTDGQWLASSDDRSRTHIFNLDSISYQTTLPTFPLPAQHLTFDPLHPSVLLLTFPNNTIQLYDVESRQFPLWGKELSASLPHRFTFAHDPVLGAMFEPPASSIPDSTPLSNSNDFSMEGVVAGTSTAISTQKEKTKTRFILFWGATWIFKVSLDTSPRLARKKRRRDSLAAADSGTGDGGRAGTGGREDDDRPWRDSKMITQYRPLLCVDFLSKRELVVVERPLVDVLATLPPAYFKHKYGRS